MQKKTHQILKFFLLYILSTFFLGCASLSLKAPAITPGIKGVYHQVKKGQTLWRISQIYGVELERLASLNRLADTSRIYSGQLIFIPGASHAAEDLTLARDIQDQGGDFIWPAKGKINSFFGMKKDRVKNKGIFIQTTKATAILAARSGKVAFTSEGLKGYGKIVILEHLDGYSTVYAQNSKNLVKLNQLVKQGQAIALCGSSENNPEVYFEIRKGYKAQNPFFYLP